MAKSLPNVTSQPSLASDGPTAAAAPFIEIVQQGDEAGIRFNLHQGQAEVMAATKRIIAALAGTQGGKSVLGPAWLLQEIQRRGPGDYMVVTPTYPLLELKALPEFLNLFDAYLQLGKMRGHAFCFSKAGEAFLFGSVQKYNTRVIFGHASNPDSLEAATAKAAWLDEAGQSAFKMGSWEAINRRLAVNQGRILITTTPYNMSGWLYNRVYKEWLKADRNHPDIEVISFRSIDNPAYPRAEWERARRSLPRWKFRMFHEGLFERPAGLIYEGFDPLRHTCKRFAIPSTWQRWLGLDFGGVNTAGVFLAEEKIDREGPDPKGRALAGKATGRYFLYRSYHAGTRTAKQHVGSLLTGEPMRPYAVGGAYSEQQWRDEFRAAGLSVNRPPISDIEVGLDRVAELISRDSLIIFDDVEDVLEEIATYSREVDDSGNPTEAIADQHSFHRMDGLRYIGSYLHARIPQGGWKLEVI